MISFINSSLPAFLQTLLDDLNQLIGPVYLVGGTVRNGLQGKPPTNDFNILVARPLTECRKLLVEKGYPSGVTTSRHNALILPIKGEEKPKTVEISTFRHRLDQKPTIEEDLLQRDITVNAMAYQWPNGPIIDPFNGQQDLIQRKIRLVNGLTTLEEDAVRALRFFRFSLQLSAEPEPTDLIHASATSLANVSPDRIRAELDRIFSFPLRTEPDRTLFLQLFDSPIGIDLLPMLSTLKGIPQANNRAKTVWDQTLQVILSLSSIPSDEDISLLDLRWSALFIGMSSTCSRRERLFSAEGLKSPKGDSSYCCKTLLDDFCFSKRRQRRIINLLRHLNLVGEPSDRVLKRMLNDNIPIEGLYRLHHAWNQAGASTENPDHERQHKESAELQEVLDRCRTIRWNKQRPRSHDLALSGGEILNIVRKPPGPWLGKLQCLLIEYINNAPFKNRPDVLEKRIQEWILDQKSI